jgi:hypothetical protein
VVANETLTLLTSWAGNGRGYDSAPQIHWIALRSRKSCLAFLKHGFDSSTGFGSGVSPFRLPFEGLSLLWLIGGEATINTSVGVAPTGFGRQTCSI